MNKKKGFVLLIFMLSILNMALAEDFLLMSAPPRETAEAGKEAYESTAAFISKTIGKTVKYEHPGDWLRYQSNMRKDKYDIVFDGPHFASWRMSHLEHDMLVKLPGSLQFYLLTSADNNSIKSAKDLIGKKICAISPPNLSSLSVLESYHNPVRQPVIKGVQGNMAKVYKEFQDGLCEGLVLRTTFYQKKLSDNDRTSLKILFESKKMPNQVISVSKRLSPDQKARLQVALLSEEGKAVIQPILTRFAPKADSMVAASAKEYEGFNTLLEGVIFGW